MADGDEVPGGGYVPGTDLPPGVDMFGGGTWLVGLGGGVGRGRVSSSSTSKTRVAPGGITPGRPWSP